MTYFLQFRSYMAQLIRWVHQHVHLMSKQPIFQHGYSLYQSYGRVGMSIFISALMLALLVFVARPYTGKIQDQLNLKLSQSRYLTKELLDAQSVLSHRQHVAVFDEHDLEKFKLLLSGKGMKPSDLKFQAINHATLSLQLHSVPFASFIDVLNEARQTWHMYPMQLTVTATNSQGIVDIKTQLIQFRHDARGQLPDLVSQ